MKCLSLWQPWASAIALGSKRIETRSWPTNYRGPLAIHASKRWTREEQELNCYYYWCAALGTRMAQRDTIWDKMPLGCVVATCDLVDCRPTGSFRLDEIEHERRSPLIDELGALHSYTWTERLMGNFELGRFGWVLDNIKPLAEPIPFKGAQGLFEVPDELLRLAS